MQKAEKFYFILFNMKENKAIELCVLYFPYLDQMDTEQSKSFHITNNKTFFQDSRRETKNKQ